MNREIPILSWNGVFRRVIIDSPCKMPCEPGKVLFQVHEMYSIVYSIGKRRLKRHLRTYLKDIQKRATEKNAIF